MNKFHISTFKNAKYIRNKGDRKPTIRYLMFVGSNLVMWSKKQNVVSQFSAKVGYCSMEHNRFELLYLKNCRLNLVSKLRALCLFTVIISLPSMLLKT